MKKTLALVFALAFVASPALAFHDAGVADCAGCHTMHNSQDGALVDPDSPNGNPYLLVDASPSDVCLGCHATGLGAVLATDPLVPGREIGGGNFTFLYEDNLNDGHNGGLAANWIPGDAAGHNLDAPGFSLTTDATLTTAPGGAFVASNMGCTSCHDPHGNENFRLLYGQRTVQGIYNFTNDAPVAAGGPSIFFGGGEANNNHTAYVSGMSAWCGNCHGDFHAASTPGNYVHPSGYNMGTTVAGIYNAYNGTMDQTGGTQATAYLAAVPFEDASAVPTSEIGPTGTSTVMCLSCHRAHASSAPDAGRWDFGVTLLVEDGVESLSYPIPDPYASPNQRSLCNKCHNKDQDDHITP